MDELTPEWIFNKKNHNWFAWQFGYEKRNFMFDSSYVLFEYNWTDQRIYKHKYNINDYYSHELPLGFWAGPHAEELLMQYVLPIKTKIIKLGASITKRGAVGKDLIQGNYQDTYNSRYHDGYEHKLIQYATIEGDFILERVNYTIGVKRVEFQNIELQKVNLSKISVEFGLYYNFSNEKFD